MNTATMKMAAATLAASLACAVLAMPTADEIKSAGDEMRAALATRIASWQKGDISHADMAALMLLQADKYDKDGEEARHYVCLQAAFAAAAKAGDASLAAKSLATIREDTPGFSEAHETALLDKALSGMDAAAAAGFRQKLDEALADGTDAATQRTIARMKEIVFPGVSLRAPATLADAVAYLEAFFVDEGARHGDTALPAGGDHGLYFLVAADGSGDPAKMPLPALNATGMSLYDMLDMVCGSVGFRFVVKGNIVLIGTDKSLSKMVSIRRRTAPSAGDARVIEFLKQAVADDVAFHGATLGQAVEWFQEESRKQGGTVAFLVTGDRAAELVRTPIPMIRARKMSLYDAIGLVCQSAGCACECRDGMVVITPLPEATGE